MSSVYEKVGKFKQKYIKPTQLFWLCQFGLFRQHFKTMTRRLSVSGYLIKAPFINGKYTKGFPFLPKMVYKG